jgi:hypothetical protein
VGYCQRKLASKRWLKVVQRQSIYLPSMHEALSWLPSSVNKEKGEREEKRQSGERERERERGRKRED